MYLAGLVVLAGVLNGVFSLTVNIQPTKIHIRPNDTTTIMCKADGPISGCQFTWKNHLLQGPIIDLSLGPASPINPANLQGDVSDYLYAGSGLDNGECGMTVTISRWGSRIVGCRVRPSSGGWIYADVGMQVDIQPQFPLATVPTAVVVREGEDVNITCAASEPLRDCTISVPGIFLIRFNHGHQSEQSDKMRYFGTGLEHGQCGVSLLGVTNTFNGRLLCAAKTSERKGYELGTVAVIVAKAPTFVELNIKENPIPDGNQLEASCTVKDSRPAPLITWYLGGEKIRQDDVDDSPPSIDWEWKNLTRTITQTITRPVTGGDNGKELRCEAEHVALTNRLAQTRVLSVDAPPTCPALKISSLEVTCDSRDYKTKCTEPSPPGTIASLYCKIGYILRPPYPPYSSVTCTRNGTWSNPIYECVLDCGKRNVKGGETLISNGETAYVGEFPWHMAIYQIVNSSNVHICGGTLISPDLVVSAAHCFWSNQNGKANRASLYRVAAGKHFREWNKIEKVPAQKRDVVEIYIPDRYRGREGNFNADIAILRLSSPVEITTYVNAICVDWVGDRENHILFDGNNGTVPGWGFTETGQQSDELKVVNLPFVPFIRCHNSLPSGTRPLLTQNKFCAGYVNKSISVCRGDSGGGLVFFDNRTDRYYLRGVVSIAFKPFENNDLCFSQLYTAFTTFSQFIVWAKGYFNSVYSSQ